MLSGPVRLKMNPVNRVNESTVTLSFKVESKCESIHIIGTESIHLSGGESRYELSESMKIRQL